jgi:class 3 adenylate cyclase
VILDAADGNRVRAFSATAIDPEAPGVVVLPDVRGLHPFEQTRIVLERHGGTVEKSIGDAVMAVFGVPTKHEMTLSEPRGLPSRCVMRCATSTRRLIETLGSQSPVGSG